MLRQNFFYLEENFNNHEDPTPTDLYQNPKDFYMLPNAKSGSSIEHNLTAGHIKRVNNPFAPLDANHRSSITFQGATAYTELKDQLETNVKTLEDFSDFLKNKLPNETSGNINILTTPFEINNTLCFLLTTNNNTERINHGNYMTRVTQGADLTLTNNVDTRPKLIDHINANSQKINMLIYKYLFNNLSDAESNVFETILDTPHINEELSRYLTNEFILSEHKPLNYKKLEDHETYFTILDLTNAGTSKSIFENHQPTHNENRIRHSIVNSLPIKNMGMDLKSITQTHSIEPFQTIVGYNNNNIDSQGPVRSRVGASYGGYDVNGNLVLKDHGKNYLTSYLRSRSATSSNNINHIALPIKSKVLIVSTNEKAFISGTIKLIRSNPNDNQNNTHNDNLMRVIDNFLSMNTDSVQIYNNVNAGGNINLTTLAYRNKKVIYFKNITTDILNLRFYDKHIILFNNCQIDQININSSPL